jgi:hypothetical protein
MIARAWRVHSDQEDARRRFIGGWFTFAAVCSLISDVALIEFVLRRM